MQESGGAGAVPCNLSKQAKRGGSKGKAGEQTGERNEVLKSEIAYPCGFQAILQSYLHLQVASDCVTLAYSNRDFGGEWQPMNYPVRLDWTACHYGGQRAWWLCPVVGCGRRVAVLYSGAVFACRHCRKLAYQSQRESPEDRAARKANKLRARLGWKAGRQAGIFNPAGGRPKGMHWATYWQLKASHDVQAQQILGGIYVNWGRQPP